MLNLIKRIPLSRLFEKIKEVFYSFNPSKKPIFGLDISDNSIEVMLLSKFLGKVKLVSYGRKVLKGEIVKDGIIKKPDVLAKAISEVLAQSKPRPIKTKECILSLPESKVYTHVFNFPVSLNKEQIKNALPYEAEKVIPFKSDEIYFDFKIIRRRHSGMSPSNDQQVFYAAVENNIIEAYNQVLVNAGLKPIAFDLESISLARSLISKKERGKAILLMDVGARSTNLNIFFQNAIHLNTLINIAGNHFTKVIARDLKITEEKAEELKAQAGLDPAKKGAKLFFLLQKEFQRIIKETKEEIDYFQRRSEVKVEKIILAGGSALLPQLDKYLAENFEIEVVIGQPVTNLKLEGDNILKNQEVLYANVAGLALRSLNLKPAQADINLNRIKVKKLEIVPPKEEKKEWQKIYISLAVFIVLAGFLIFLIWAKKYNKFFFRPAAPEESQNIEVDEEQLDVLRQQSQEPEEAIEEKQIVILVASLNVREGPGYDYSILEKVYTGEKFPLLEEREDWYKIQLDDETVGWVVAEYVEIE